MLALLAGGALIQVITWVRASRVATTALGLLLAAYLVWLVTNTVLLHPLQYVAMNALAGGTKGAHGHFELDYWGAAATEAVRRLEQRLDREAALPEAAHSPRVLVCIPWRERQAQVLFRRDWVVETNLSKADFVIATARSRCTEGKDLELIDRVERLGLAFAWTYENTQRRN
jgi:hypothetical protein